MWKNNRPDGWKTPNVIALKEVKAGFVMADQVRFLTREECKAYEAGADAMLEALKKNGYPIRAGESFGDSETGARTIVKVNGFIVFTPEES